MQGAMSKPVQRRSVRWIHELRVDGAIAFRTGKQGNDLVAHWPGKGTLTCASDGSNARFVAVTSASRQTIGKLQGAQVRGLLRDLAGQPSVHGSAVNIGGRAVLFLGSDGAGKSTAAAEMCLLHNAEMLADDGVALDVGSRGVHVVPSEDEHWLTRESCIALGVHSSAALGQKRRMLALKVGREPCPLALVLALRFDDSVSRAVLLPARGVDAARWLLEGSIRFDVEDGAARWRELEQLNAVYNCAPFLQLLRPARDPGRVAEVVLEALGRGRS
jgi:hypothetical protein